jgi:class 3 adenylate cyclase
MAGERSLEDVLTRFFRAQSRPGDAAEPGPADVEHVVRTLGLDPARLDDDERSALEATVLALGLRLDADTLLALAQAFGRSTGRMVDAETEIVRRRLRDVEPQDRAEALDVFLHAARPLADRLIATTHQLRLHQALQEALGEDGIGEAAVPQRSIALIDHVRSTPWLRHATAEETAAFVDRLHDCAHAVCTGRRVAAVKFMGDGVYLSGPSAADVLGAALDLVTTLDDAPLRARAGLAHGPLLRRAGDYFGYAVNLASRLTEAAEPGTVLAVADAVPIMPEGVRADTKRVALRGLEGDFDVLALRAPA